MLYNSGMPKYIRKPLTRTEMRYRGMLQRVKLSNGQYGRRGLYKEHNITICPRWLPTGKRDGQGFKNFLEDMGECPEGMTLDRIDNTKGYFPENCRWANWNTQNANRSNCSEYPGVRFDGKYWRAVLKKDGKFVLQTRRKTKESAIAARKEAEKLYNVYG